MFALIQESRDGNKNFWFLIHREKTEIESWIKKQRGLIQEIKGMIHESRLWFKNHPTWFKSSNMIQESWWKITMIQESEAKTTGWFKNQTRWFENQGPWFLNQCLIQESRALFPPLDSWFRWFVKPPWADFRMEFPVIIKDEPKSEVKYSIKITSPKHKPPLHPAQPVAKKCGLLKPPKQKSHLSQCPQLRRHRISTLHFFQGIPWKKRKS